MRIWLTSFVLASAAYLVFWDISDKVPWSISQWHYLAILGCLAVLAVAWKPQGNRRKPRVEE